MDAVVLAGGLNSGALQKVSSVRYEAEIEIAGRPMLDYVIMALENVRSINRILVIGADSVISKEVKSKVALTVNPGVSLFDSLAGGLKALNANGPVLVVSSDIPMITREAFEDFLERCRNRKGDIYYSFVSKDVNDQKYPGVQRTYVKLKDGVFTGGNLALISPQVVQDNIEMLRKAASLRKKPIQLCSMLGWRHLFKLMTGRLTIKEIEERVFKAFKFTAVGIISPYPEVGIDVDKPSDLQLARQVLASQK